MTEDRHEIEMPVGGQEALDTLFRTALTDALECASSETFDSLTPCQARSLAASALVRAAASIAAEGARWEDRRPRITRFLRMCRHHFEAERDGPWREFKPLLRFIVTFDKADFAKENHHD